MPQISVIVPIYKVEPYLCRCLDSIIAQSFIDYELILVDDGSPDNCGSICDSYALRDSRIRVIHKENGGLSSARNAGIDWALNNSNSEWICFIDSDDWVHKDYLRQLLSVAEKYSVSICACKYETTNIRQDTSFAISNLDRCLSTEDFFCLVEKGLSVIASWAKLYRKSLFLEIRYPVGAIYEDLFTTHKLLFQVPYIALINECLYFYNDTNISITRSEWNVKRWDEVRAGDQLIAYMRCHRLQNGLRRAIQRQCGVICRQLLEIKQLNKEKSKDYKKLRRELCRIILLNKRLIKFRNNEWIYDNAFPALMWGYWNVQIVLKKVLKKI